VVPKQSLLQLDSGGCNQVLLHQIIDIKFYRVIEKAQADAYASWYTQLLFRLTVVLFFV
jgi:hypothetical protein